MNHSHSNPHLPDVVYHYCSVETFFQIVTNHTLRLSDIEKSNDFMEKKWAIQQCLLHIENNLDNPAYPCSTRPDLATSLLRELKHRFEQFNTMILASCFSSERDLLSQWRGYGDNGYGISIGVSSGTEFVHAYHRAEKYMDLEDHVRTFPTGLLFHNVQYTTEEIENSCMQLFCTYISWLPLKVSIAEASTELTRIIYPALPFFKSHAFSEEREWRCVYYPKMPAPPYEADTLDEEQFQRLLSAQALDYESDHFVLQPLSYRLRKSNLVPYRDMSFDAPCGPFIRSVTIGPKCALDRETVKVFLERNHIPINMSDIYLSDVSYR